MATPFTSKPHSPFSSLSAACARGHWAQASRPRSTTLPTKSPAASSCGAAPGARCATPSSCSARSYGGIITASVSLLVTFLMRAGLPPIVSFLLSRCLAVGSTIASGLLFVTKTQATQRAKEYGNHVYGQARCREEEATDRILARYDSLLPYLPR